MPTFYLTLLPALLLLFVILPAQRARNMRLKQIRKKKKRTQGDINMNELINSFIGKECIIFNSQYSGIEGTITKLQDNWIEVTSKDSVQLLNVDYITRIQEYPLNKKGKKKAVVI